MDDNLKEKYEIFHQNTKTSKKLVTNKDFTYKNILSIINEYLTPNMKVLDIGCSNGVLSLYIANKGNDVLGIDISEKAITKAKNSAKYLKINTATFRAMNFLESHFEDKYDFIILNAVLEHLPRQEHALKIIRSYLKPGGLLFISVPSVNDTMHKIRKCIYNKDFFDERVGHLRRYKESDLLNLLNNEGFESLLIESRGGILRSFFYYTKVGNKIIRFVKLPIIKTIIGFIDNLTKYLVGGYEIYNVSKKL